MASWFSTRRPLVAAITSGTAIAALIATIAVVSTGYTAQRMDLTDPSVWVVGSSHEAIGRANTDVFQLDSIIETDAERIEVVQSGATVILVDRASATMRAVDPATATLGDVVALPPQDPRLLIAGERAAVFAAGTGELWLLPLAELESFDASAPSTLSLGVGAAIAVTPSGALFAYVPDAAEVWRVERGATAVSDRASISWSGSAPFGDAAQLSAVGEDWAVLDADTSILATAAGLRDLADELTGSSVRLQQSGPAADRVLVGHSTGVLAVPLRAGATEQLTDAGAGVPAAPVVVGECRFAAWSSGTAWRDCAGEEAVTLPLAQLGAGAALSFAVNQGHVALNDSFGGESWAVQSSGELIDNWESLLIDQDRQEEEPQADDETPPELEQVQAPPIAVDDDLGARPGRSSVLPVLLNDYDPNGDVLVVTAFDQIDETLGRVDLVSRNQQLQLTLSDDAAGIITFGYTISDGRGGFASAVVTVTVRGEFENSPPRAVRTSTATVVSGGRVSTQVIGDWIDPDGDAIYLTGASIAAPDQVGYKPDGVVVFTDSGEGTGAKTVALAVSDGRETAGGSLQVTVRDRGDVPILIEPWVVLASAGEEVTIRPLQHVRGGNGPIRLGGVPPKLGTTIVPSFEAGTFTFLSVDARTHYLEFTVTDGTQTATGFVRVDVSAPADASTRPITVPKTLFMTTDSTQTVDPSTTDIDPAGGVLVVTGVMNLPPYAGVTAEVLDQRRVRVSLTAPLDGPLTFNYRISNGLASADGTITIVEIAHPQRLQPPIATDDQVTVRAGDTIDIHVLDNDEQPDGKEITLLPDLAADLPADAGLLFAAGDRLRYLAPETAGNYEAVYTISGSDGQLAQARVLISVRERNAATNNPPVPRTVTARALAGQTVSIDIPVNGVDPDGDAVQLVGQSTNPEKGSVISVEGSTIRYQAGEYSLGTDTFQYTLVDGLGARATGTIRVGISPPLEGARNPVANFDAVSVRQGRTVSVRALLNDSDPDGSALRIRQVEPNTPDVAAEIVGDDVVRITPPNAPGDYSVVYTIENDTGGTSSNFIRVTVSADAPLSRPTVTDTVLTVTDVIDADTVDVSVLDRAFFADGEVRDLGVELVEGYSETAEVLPSKRVRVTIGDRSQIIPFAVVHPDAPQIRAFAFIRVPGYDDALPQINTKAPPLVVNSESTLRIELSQYVVALGGSRVRLTDSSTVRATHANGASLVVDDDTLEFTSADRYWGPASITFEVTDGGTAANPVGNVATLSLPIRVDARDNQPPVFSGAVIDFEPGQSRELDLVKLTKYPYDDDIDELAYTVLDPVPSGFSVQLNGQRLLLTADASSVKGTATTATLGVRDAINEGQAGRLQLRIVPSTRPLAKTIADQSITRRGETTVVDVLANDAATNPFPSVPLKVVDIRGLGGSSLPPGITISPSADRSRLSITVADSASPVDTTLQYQVADATNDPDRYVWGTVTISVQDVPDPVSNLRITEFGDRLLKLGWAPGAFNNSPISEYRVAVIDSSSGDPVSTTTCTVTVGCAISTPGNGPSHALRISVVAVNAIGASDPVALTGVWSDVIPLAPSVVAATPVDRGLRVTWQKPSSGAGSAIDSYVVSVGGVSATLNVDSGDPAGTPYSRTITNAGFVNGSAIPFSVSARNRAPNSLATWNEAGGTAIPAGAPIVAAAPTAIASTTDGTTATVSWAGAFTDNGRAITDFYAAVHGGTAPACTVTGVEQGAPVLTPPSGSGVQHLGSGTTATFGGLTPNVSYTFTVYAYNGQGCTASAPVTATPRAAPGDVVIEPGDISGLIDRGDGRWDFQLVDLNIPSGSSDVDSFVYRLSGGTTDGSESSPVAVGSFLTSGTTHYGNTVSVEVKACRGYGPDVRLCSPNWSSSVTVGRAVSIQLGGLLAVETVAPADGAPGQGHWTWTSGPVVASGGTGYDSVSFTCGPADDPSTAGVCEVVGVGVDSDYPDLVVSVTSAGIVYSRTFDWAEAPH